MKSTNVTEKRAGYFWSRASQPMTDFGGIMKF